MVGRRSRSAVAVGTLFLFLEEFDFLRVLAFLVAVSSLPSLATVCL